MKISATNDFTFFKDLLESRVSTIIDLVVVAIVVVSIFWIPPVIFDLYYNFCYLFSNSRWFNFY